MELRLFELKKKKKAKKKKGANNFANSIEDQIREEKISTNTSGKF